MYRKQQERTFSCQLIAAINARIFLGGSDVSEKEFEELVRVVNCGDGGALYPERSYPDLGLKYEDGSVSLDWITKHLPVSISVDARYNQLPDWNQTLHEALVIEVVGDCLRVLNLDYGDEDTMVAWRDLEERFPSGYLRACRSFSYACG